MNEIKIREDKVSLDGQELKTLTEFEIKSTTEDGYAEVKLTLLAKLTWKEQKNESHSRFYRVHAKRPSNP